MKAGHLVCTWNYGLYFEHCFGMHHRASCGSWTVRTVPGEGSVGRGEGGKGLLPQDREPGSAAWGECIQTMVKWVSTESVGLGDYTDSSRLNQISFFFHQDFRTEAL